MVSAIFPAAGQGRRMHAGCNKVFLELAGEPILVRTLRQFSQVKEIGELIVVAGAGEEDDVRAMLTNAEARARFAPWRVVTGGSERQYSVWNGLKVSSPGADVVLVHDAARPLIRPEVIEHVIARARCTGGAIAAMPSKDTVKVVDAQNCVTATPDRRTLWCVQTPQGFCRDLLIAANEKAMADHFLGTDDASLVERLGAPVEVVEGGYENIKVTTPGDLIIAEALLSSFQPPSQRGEGRLRQGECRR